MHHSSSMHEVPRRRVQKMKRPENDHNSNFVAHYADVSLIILLLCILNISSVVDSFHQGILPDSTQMWAIRHSTRSQRRPRVIWLSSPSSEGRPDRLQYSENDATKTGSTNSLLQINNATTINESPAETKRLGIISPWNILLGEAPDYADLSSPISYISSRPRSLQASLRLFNKVLELIANSKDDKHSILSKQSREIIDMLDKNSIIYENNMKIIRIEIPIVTSATVDPLAWLHAQELHLSKQQILQQSQSKSHPMFYLNTHESNIEVAAIGGALCWNTTNQLWNDIYNVLPQNSFVYGGQRFDHNIWNTTESNDDEQQERKRKISKEWEHFGEAFWMLPLIELRQQSASIRKITLAMHLVCPNKQTKWSDIAQTTSNNLFRYLSSIQSARVPSTTLPPIISRSTRCTTDGQELYETAFDAAMNAFSANGTSTQHDVLQKVVIARQQTLHFATKLSSSLDIIRRWKYGGHEGGHLFWLKPPVAMDQYSSTSEFLGCTPERLFQVGTIQNHEFGQKKTIIRSEALAGTRPRGSTQYEDELLQQELWASPKDRQENALTGKYIKDVFDQLYGLNMIRPLQNDSARSGSTSPTGQLYALNDKNENLDSSLLSLSPSTGDQTSNWSKGFFVRRLLHLQHICQSYTAELAENDNSPTSRAGLNACEILLSRLHPTPAVCGLPTTKSLSFIERYESVGFDRGFYSGPIGYIGHNEADILVGIRSGLALTSNIEQNTASRSFNVNQCTELSVYAGAGIVPASKLKDEWAETNYKFAVLSSLLPQSPVTLRSATTPNVAWATSFIEELIRNGITRFYVCPGSRSTPLVVAIARAVRANSVSGSGGGIVHAVSVHDERSAAFRCLGYGRGLGRPAAIVTSSGTAVANLYPAIIEAGMEGIPMLVLTADRPYESRDSGANQAIDQVKVFSSSYIRWFRDVLPPSDDVPVSVALSDASHAVAMSRQLRGPVHMNLQFRENLAPESGNIRSDNRINSIVRFDGARFTDVPGFLRWSKSGDKWSKTYSYFDHMKGFMSPFNYGEIPFMSSAVLDVVNLIRSSKRGIIVVGNLRIESDEDLHNDQSLIAQAIADFSETIAFPVFAGVQSGNLRFISSAVVPFAEHLLRCPPIFNSLKPDLIIQIGAPIVSSVVSDMIKFSMKISDNDINESEFSTSVAHVLIHPHAQHERSDPSFTVTHKIPFEISQFVSAVTSNLLARNENDNAINRPPISSQLAPLIHFGRKLQSEMKAIIEKASNPAENSSRNVLTEPQIIVALSETMSSPEFSENWSLFLSNSMPIRDAESFLYPYKSSEELVSRSRDVLKPSRGLMNVGVNRGASGIDGIIASALGFAESTQSPTTLLIGDMATIHDIGSFHSVRDSPLASNQAITKRRYPLATVVINNNGGGIFSFLPIAEHGNDVGFEEFFGTPTNSFSFRKAAEAFGLKYKLVSNYESFRDTFTKVYQSKQDFIVEAVVADREANVQVHKSITRSVQSWVERQLSSVPVTKPSIERLPMKVYSMGNMTEFGGHFQQKRVALLLHGWMGDKSEWGQVAVQLREKLDSEWVAVAIDLPGHGASTRLQSDDACVIRSALNLVDDDSDDLNVDYLASSVLATLSEHHSITKLDMIAGYSLGGRVALAMKRLASAGSTTRTGSSMLDNSTVTILLGVHPGDLPKSVNDQTTSTENLSRMMNDDAISSILLSISDRSFVQQSRVENKFLWQPFLNCWYGKPMWGKLSEGGMDYRDLVIRRTTSLDRRGRDLALILAQCSPSRNTHQNWRYCSPERTLFVAGSLDSKYVALADTVEKNLSWRVERVQHVGHALLIEAPDTVANLIADFTCLDGECSVGHIDGNVVEAHVDTVNNDIGKQVIADGEKAAETTYKRMEVGNGIVIGSLDIKPFSISLSDKESNNDKVFGIGWGQNAKATPSTSFDNRSGFIIQLDSLTGSEVGIGEVSPLAGVHFESSDEARDQLLILKSRLASSAFEERPIINPHKILLLDGSLQDALREIEAFVGTQQFVPSVRSGLEMGILAICSQKVGLPLHQALLPSAFEGRRPMPTKSFLISGLITRVSTTRKSPIKDVSKRRFPSIKVKVGHQNLQEDAISMLRGFQSTELYHGKSAGFVRADANRAWNESQALEFASALEGLDVQALQRIEFVEEPLQQCYGNQGRWNLADQIEALERTYFHTGIRYALDESIADIVSRHDSDFIAIEAELMNVFPNGSRGCAAFVLKPALLGLELSIQLARLAKTNLRIGVVFSSCFDSGIGLAFNAFLGHIINQLPSENQMYAHGIGTFTMMDSDTLSPPFESFVNEYGVLNVPSLSRAMYGLSLDEMSGETEDSETQNSMRSTNIQEKYEASTATSTSGKEISVVVNLPLPFSSDTACARFTDLPSMSRWSPWISSVQYQGAETEWTINVRGIPLKWRAASQIVNDPFPGIMWQSVSGLSNSGIVEFIPNSSSSCTMNVRMTIVTPRLLKPLFQGTSLFVEEFLRDKLLKWSLEMFRDVVKADLAIER